MIRARRIVLSAWRLQEMNNNTTVKKSPLKFYLLVIALSIPFWVVGAMYGVGVGDMACCSLYSSSQ